MTASTNAWENAWPSELSVSMRAYLSTNSAVTFL